MSEEPITTENVLEELADNTQTGGVGIKQQLLLVSGVMLLLLAISLPSMIHTSSKPAIATPQASVSSFIVEDEVSTDATFATATAPFSEVSIIGSAAYVWDVSTQRALYKKNEQESLPLASVTKLMTALLASEIIAADESVTVSDQALRQNGNSGLLVNERFRRESLSDLTLVSSSNDGAYALASAAGSLVGDHGVDSFVAGMNIRAEELNLYNTHFNNPTGLDESATKAGGYGSAKDMAFLLEYIITHTPEIIEYTSDSSTLVASENAGTHQAHNTNYTVDRIPGLIASKTGYTDLAGGNLVIAYDAGLNRPIIIAVLGSTQQHRFTDVLTLVDATSAYLEQE